jgi:hypothetical protein
METTCSVCQESHFIPVGNICLRCVQKLKHRKDVEEFIKSAETIVVRTDEPMKTDEVLITDF